MNNFLFNYFATKAKKDIVGQKVTHIYGSLSSIVLNLENGSSIFFKLDSPSALFFGNYQLPKTQSNFAISLHKKINKLKVIDVGYTGLERVLVLHLLDKRLDIEHYYYLVFEITGRNGNLILCDNNWKIIESLRYVQSRQILPNRTYNKPSKMLDITTDNIDVIKRAFHRENILGIDSFVKKFITEKNIDDFIEISRKPYETLFQYTFKTRNFIYPFYFEFVENISTIDEKTLFNQIFITNTQKSSNKTKTINFIDKKLKKINEKIEKIQNDIQKAQDADKMKLYADTLLENISTVKLNKLNNDVIYLKPHGFTKDIAIPVNPEKTIQYNISLYYKLYKKYKNAKNILESLLDQSKQEYINVTKLKEQLLNDSIDIKDINFLSKKTNHTVKHIEVSSYEHFNILGFDIYIGNNAKSNEIILKNASKEDVWMHPKNIPGPHLIIKNPQRLQEINKALLEQCAQKIKEKMHTYNKIEVDYTFVKFVKKPKGFKKGRVTYSNFKTVVAN